MYPIGSTTLGVAMLILLGGMPANGQLREPAPDDVRLTLTQHTVWGGTNASCVFTVELIGDAGAMSGSCGKDDSGSSGAAPSAGAVRRRALTESENAALRRLYASARLFEGGHIGADYSAADLPFELLVVRPVRTRGRAVALVVSGNSTFDTGPRKALLDWLLRERSKLFHAAAQKDPQ